MVRSTDTAARHQHGGAFIGWGAVAFIVPIVLLLLANLGALIWGAATIKLTVDTLATAVEKMQTTQAQIVVNLAVVTDRQAYMQHEVEEHDERLDKMEQK